MADLKLKATMTRRTLLQAAPLVAPAAALGFFWPTAFTT